MEIVMDKTTKKQKMLYIKNLRKNGFRKLSKRQKWENYKFVEIIDTDFIFVKDRKKSLYFGKEVEDAIIRYNNTDDLSLRNQLYSQIIHAAFDKLAENIINTFKFTYFDYGFEDIKCETVAFLVINMHKYNPDKGYKAFSYFSVVAKNYLILHNNNNYKKLKSHRNIDDTAVSNQTQFMYDPNKDDMIGFTEELVEYLEIFIPKTFKKKRDISIAYSILELLKSRDTVENFNKKAIYLLIREMTGYNTSHITKIVNVLKKEYKNLLKQYYSTGSILKDDLHKKFFK